MAGEKIEKENLEELIKEHMPFLIRRVSAFTGRYVSIENDDEFSVALSAFAEAVEKYEPERGAFLGFAGLVIDSRLKTYIRKEKGHLQTISLEEMQESGQEPSWGDPAENNGLREEILQYREELLLFGLTLEHLADAAPRHKDTRITAMDVAKAASKDRNTVETTYRKRKLPVREVARIARVTEKIVKGSKVFILATMIIFVRQFPGLLDWIQGVRCVRHV